MSRGEVDLKIDRPVSAFDFAIKRPTGFFYVGLGWRHEIGYLNRAIVGFKLGLQDVRSGKIPLFGFGRFDWIDSKMAASIDVENGRKDAWGLNVWQRIPRYRAGGIHERTGLQVSDDSV